MVRVDEEERGGFGFAFGDIRRPIRPRVSVGRGIVRLDASWNTTNVQAHCLILTLVTRALCRRIFTSRITQRVQRRFHHAKIIIIYIIK